MILSIVAVWFFLAVFVFLVGLVMTIFAFVMRRPIKRAACIVVTSLAVGLVMLGIARTYVIAENVKQEKVEKQAARDTDDKAKFDAAYQTVTTVAYTNLRAAEELGEKVQTTWKAAIFEDAGALVAGKRYTNFSDAVRELLKTEAGTVSKITSGETRMKAAIKVMTNHKKAGDSEKLKTAQKLVEAVHKYDRTTTSPSGNLTTFSNNFAQQSTDLTDLLMDYYTS